MMALTLNVWLLNKFMTSSAVGIYGIALLFPQLVNMPLASISSAMYPSLARLMADGSHEARRQHARLCTMMMMGMALLLLGVNVFGPPAIRLMTAPQYHGALVFVPILILTRLFMGFYVIALPPLFYKGGGVWLSAATVSSVAASVVLSFILIPRYGIHGAAWALVGFRAVHFIIIAVVSYRLYPVSYEGTKILRILAVGGLLVFADIWTAHVMSFAMSLAIKFIILAAYIPLLWLTGAVRTGELLLAKNTLAEIAQRRLRKKGKDKGQE